jgi:hypothetical protein
LALEKGIIDLFGNGELVKEVYCTSGQLPLFLRWQHSKRDGKIKENG